MNFDAGNELTRHLDIAVYNMFMVMCSLHVRIAVELRCLH